MVIILGLVVVIAAVVMRLPGHRTAPQQEPRSQERLDGQPVPNAPAETPAP